MIFVSTPLQRAQSINEANVGGMFAEGMLSHQPSHDDLCHDLVLRGKDSC